MALASVEFERVDNPLIEVSHRRFTWVAAVHEAQNTGQLRTMGRSL